MPFFIFLLVFYFAQNQYQTEFKHSKTFWRFFLDQKTHGGPRKYQRGAPRGAQPTWACQGPLARPGVLWAHQASPLALPWLPSCLLGRKKSPKSFSSFRLRLIWIFYEVRNKQKTTIGTGHYVNRLVPKMI